MRIIINILGGVIDRLLFFDWERVKRRHEAYRWEITRAFENGDYSRAYDLSNEYNEKLYTEPSLRGLIF